MQYKAKDIGPNGQDVKVPVTEAWLKAELADLEARPAPEGLVLAGRIEKSEDEAPDEDDDNLEAPDVIPFEEGVIDLAGELREEILLALPQSPLCKEDCAGLCPVCGGNRNAAPCDCEEKARAANSKFGVLNKLKI